MINQLIDIIGKEAALFEAFLDLLQRQREMLVANNADGLAEITALQHEKLTESRLLNKRREELVARIKAANAIDGDLTVSRLLDLVDQNQAEKLRQLRDVMLELNEQITDGRNTNAMLLNQSRDFVSRTMAMLAKLQNPEPTYARAAAVGEPRHAMVVDRRG